MYTYRTNVLQQIFGANYIDYNSLEGDERYKKITPRRCLSHTSGLPNWRWFEDDQKLKIKFEPGTKYSYSGEGMFLLQVVLEEITGKDFEELAIEKVFDPLDMNRSSFVWQRAYEGNYAVGHDASKRKSYVASIFYLASIPLAFVNIYLAYSCFVIPMILFSLPTPKVEEKLDNTIIEKNKN